jgi:hypothetical protein
MASLKKGTAMTKEYCHYTYIWKHEASDGVTELYAGQTSRTVEQRVRPTAYAGSKFHAALRRSTPPIRGAQVKIIYRKEHRYDEECGWDAVDYHEQMLIDTIKAIQKLYPSKARVLNERSAMGCSKSASNWKKRSREGYKEKNSEGLDFSPQLLPELIKSLF